MGTKRAPILYLFVLALSFGAEAAQAGTVEDCQELRRLGKKANWIFIDQAATAILVGFAANQKNQMPTVVNGAGALGAKAQEAQLVQDKILALGQQLGVTNEASRRSICGF